MITKSKAPGGGPGAGRMARRAALPFRLYDTTDLAKTQTRPPTHKAGDTDWPNHYNAGGVCRCVLQATGTACPAWRIR